MLIGPVYIAHPYWMPTAEGRARNVERARSLSNHVNGLGVATISPLQESYGREHAFVDEDGWHDHGLCLLRVCQAVIAPDYTAGSRGCAAELSEAADQGIPIFLATCTRYNDNAVWEIEPSFREWCRVGRELQALVREHNHG